MIAEACEKAKRTKIFRVCPIFCIFPQSQIKVEKQRKIWRFEENSIFLQQSIYVMFRSEVKPYLVNKLKKSHCLWSYNETSIKDIPDDVLIELVMIYLDLDDIDKLFQIYNFKEMKKAWLENIVSQGEIH